MIWLQWVGMAIVVVIAAILYAKMDDRVDREFGWERTNPSHLGYLCYGEGMKGRLNALEHQVRQLQRQLSETPVQEPEQIKPTLADRLAEVEKATWPSCKSTEAQ